MTIIDAVSNNWEFNREWSGFSSPEYNDGKSYRTRYLAWKFILDEIKREVPVYSKNYSSKYLQGICDGIILYHVEINKVVELYQNVKKYNEEQIEKKFQNKMKEHQSNVKYYKTLGKPLPTFYDMPIKDEIIRNAKYDSNIEYIWEQKNRIRHYHQIIPSNYCMSKIENGYSNRDLYTCRILVDFKPKLLSISGVIGQLKVYRDCIGPSDLMIITYDKNEKYDPILKDENIHIMRIEEEQEMTQEEQPFLGG